MSKLQMDPPLGGVVPVQFIVRIRRKGRPPTPWAWAIYEEGQATPCRSSTQFYRSAEDAWAVGHAMLDRMVKPGGGMPDRQPDTGSGCGPTST
jgi:hypothetical protein